MAETHKVKIKHLFFPYYVDELDPATDKSIKVERLARQGDEIEVSEADYQRGVKFDSFFKDGEEPAEGFDAASASDEDLVAWLKEESPNVNETVQASQGDPETARRLLDAEQIRAEDDDDEPRKGVIDGLTSVIERGTQ